MASVQSYIYLHICLFTADLCVNVRENIKVAYGRFKTCSEWHDCSTVISVFVYTADAVITVQPA